MSSFPTLDAEQDGGMDARNCEEQLSKALWCRWSCDSDNGDDTAHQGSVLQSAELAFPLL